MKIYSLNNYSIFFVCLSGFLFSSELISSEYDGYEIYEKMVDVYREIDAYSDAGVIKTQKIRNKTLSKYIETMKFETNYDSSGYFSFRWSKTGGAMDAELNYIKSEDGSVETEIYGSRENEDDIDVALQKLAGVTYSASYFIPRYLLPDVPVLNLSAVYHISLNKIFKHHKKYKYLLNIEYTYGGVEKIWLNADYLIVKMETSIKRMDGAIVQKEITVNPKAKFKNK